MKIYEVECWAVITLAEQDMERAALRGAALIKDNPHLIFVRAVHERDFEAAREEEGRSLRLRRFDLQTTASYRKNPWKLDQRRIA